MKHTVAAVILGLLSLSLCTSVAAQETMYLPHEGDRMDYLLSNGDRAFSRVVEVSEEEEQCVAKVIQEVTRRDGSSQTFNYAFIYTPTAVGISLPFPEGENAAADVSPLICYVEQAGVEDAWMAQNGTFRIYGERTCRFSVVGQLEKIETVKVKAGTFGACRRMGFRMKLDSGSLSGSKMTIWFKPSVGIIKTRTEQEGNSFESELVAIKRAK